MIKSKCSNICQMIRVVNGYEFFFNDEWKKKDPTEKESDLSESTKSLRRKYGKKCIELLNKFSLKDSQKIPYDVRIKLKPYAPSKWETGSKREILDEINHRISEADKYEDYDGGGENFIAEEEMLVINAHGGQDTSYFFGDDPIFSDMHPNTLAEKLAKILPKNYKGEIYLAGCSTGKRKTIFGLGVPGTSFIELFRKALIEECNKIKKQVSPKVKGNLDTSISKDKGVFIRDYSYDGKEVIIKKITLFYKSGQNIYKSEFSSEIKTVLNNLDLKIGNITFKLTNYKNLTINGVAYEYITGQADFCVPIDTKIHHAILNGGLFVSGKQTKLHI